MRKQERVVQLIWGPRNVRVVQVRRIEGKSKWVVREEVLK